MVRRLADKPRKRDDGCGREHEQRRVADGVEPIEDDDDRPEEQQGCEDESAARDGEPSPEPRSSCKRRTATFVLS
jgi:hypothetical protein